MRADLHVHTYYSDGLISPEEVAAAASAEGLNLVAVTDHDCILAYPELSAACNKKGIKAVQGIEVSAYEGLVKIHTLGYNLDVKNPQFKEFSKRLYDGALIRAEDIVNKLNKNSVFITLDEVLNYRHSPLSPVHAMHVARACAKKGYCNGSAEAFFFNYLAWGKPAFSNLCRPTPEEAVEVITACGGFSSLAHPARISMERGELLSLIKRMASCGLGGIEAVYSAHTEMETAYYKETASNLRLLVTGGSDTHYFGGSRKIGSPEFYADGELAARLGI
ncbi:MAG: PHP domain-containing protein [Clostridia bacterium]|nr:PHP domain-containing protein [Clostridia bacterium]